jgi:hypothetical protein
MLILKSRKSCTSNLYSRLKFSSSVPGSLDKKVEEGSVFFKAKGDIFFRLFCLMNPAQFCAGSLDKEGGKKVPSFY